MHKKFSLLFLLVFAIVSIQCGASLAKQLFPQIGVAATTFLRVFFASLVLIPLFRPWREKLTLSQCKTVFLYGLSLGLMNSLFYLSLNKLPLGIAVALEFTGPLAVALMSSRKKIDILWSFLACLGLFMILPIFDFRGSELDPLGILYALGAGFCWAMYMIFGKSAQNSVSGKTLVSVGMGCATLASLPILFCFQGFNVHIPLQVLPMAFFIAVLSSAIPYCIESYALKKLPLTTFGILMSLEPVVAALSGQMLLSESLTNLQWAAISCIIFASVGSISTKQETLIKEKN